MLAAQRGPWLASTVELLRGQPRLHQALAHLPLGEADRVATGAEVAVLPALAGRARPGRRPTGRARPRQRLAEVPAPVLMIGGWYDIFLPWQLATTRRCGRPGRGRS